MRSHDPAARTPAGKLGADAPSGISRGLDRSRLWFHLAVGAFVIVASFLYGLQEGIARKRQMAFAGMAGFGGAVDIDDLRLRLPSGVRAAPIGQNTSINGAGVELVSFVSRRGIGELVSDQLERWRELGYEAESRVGDRRGVAIGINRSSGERYSFVAWVVPPNLRAVLSQGYPVQGTAAYSEAAIPGGGVGAAEQGVPGVPVMPGGRSGMVLGSDDPGGRSYSGLYTNPGTIEDNIAFYRDALRAAGWVEVEADEEIVMRSPFAVAAFQRGAEEVTLLFSDARQGLSDRDEDWMASTAVTVVRAPRTPVLAGAGV